MTREQLDIIKGDPEGLIRYMSARRFENFARYIMPNLEMTNFHKVYYEVLDKFAHKDIRKLIVSVAPQSGKSQGSSRFLPSFLLGLNPDNKIVIGSYNAETAKGFNADVQRIINSPQYKAVFPDSYLNTARVRLENTYKCNSEVSEMVNHTGWLRAVGRSGSLTSKTVDISILDDVYKDYQEANSPQIRELAWKWYTTVVRTRLHNDSQELIVFTRWHEDDLIGRLEKSGEEIIVADKWSDFDNIPEGAWILINFPALKEGKPTELDPREEGEALWPSKHSKEQLEAQKALDPVQFQCLYQGNPSSAEGRLFDEFKTYLDKSEYGTFVRKGCCIDVAEGGGDFCCAICYDIYRSQSMAYNEKKKKFEPILFALITDMVFTKEGTKVTYVTIPRMINEQGSQVVWIESNSGGKAFADNIEKKVRAKVKRFYQQANKETKCLTNASSVNNQIVMPYGWDTKFPEFYRHMTHFLRNFNANSNDDGVDCCSEIYLRELATCKAKPYGHNKRGIRKAN